MTGLGLYTLDEGGRPVPCDDIVTWGRWFACFHNRHVRTTHLRARGHADFIVSTIFLGLDHNYAGEGSPILWETMVLGAPDGADRQQRFRNRPEAEAYHGVVIVMMATLFDASMIVAELPRARVVEP